MIHQLNQLKVTALKQDHAGPSGDPPYFITEVQEKKETDNLSNARSLLYKLGCYDNACDNISISHLGIWQTLLSKGEENNKAIHNKNFSFFLSGLFTFSNNRYFRLLDFEAKLFE